MQVSNIGERVELFLSGRNFKDLDIFTKSDPYINVYFSRDFTVKQPMKIGRTETVPNNLNPTFKTTIVLDYLFEAKQNIRFDVLDDDGGDDDFIGSVQTTLGALMGSHNQSSILDLKKDNKTSGKIIVQCEPIREGNQFARFKFRAEKLLNTDSFFDFWDKSDPYLRLLKIREDNSLLEMAKTETILNSLNPSWRSIEVKIDRLTTLKNSMFKLQCWDWEESGKDQFIGETYLDLKTLSPQQCPKQIILANPKEKAPGRLVLENFELVQKPTYIDYLRGGLELNMIVAIDFTGSNGVPSNPTSLHYIHPQRINQYQSAILGVSQILMNYDSDKKIPAFGFGGCTRFGGNRLPVSHCFALSGNPQQLEAFGVEHLMMMYQKALLNVELSGPTYFGHILQETMKLADICKQQGSNVYQILLILTDGEIHDMQATIDLLYQAARLPLSVIIVGVGQADFTSMERLDGDNGLYNSKGQRLPRDIVQFVPFRNMQGNSDLLAKELLAELPNQVVQYMEMIGKPPGAPKVANIEAPKPNYGKEAMLQILNLEGPGQVKPNVIINL